MTGEKIDAWDNDEWSCFYVVDPETTGDSDRQSVISNQNNQLVMQSMTTSTRVAIIGSGFTNVNADSILATTDQRQHTAINTNGNELSVWRNGIAGDQNIAYTKGANDKMTIGDQTSPTRYFYGGISQILIFPTSKSAERATIETIQMNLFNV